MTLPITPREAKEKKLTGIPAQVIEAFNELIAKSYQDGLAVVVQKEVVALICQKMDVSKDEIFENHWLDVEPLFKRQGWIVDYDKPGYNETYEATFTFHSKRGR